MKSPHFAFTLLQGDPEYKIFSRLLFKSTAAAQKILLDAVPKPIRQKFAPQQATNAPEEKNEHSLTEKEARDILGVDKNASKADCRAAYRKLMKQYHTDKADSDGAKAKQLNAAKEKLNL